MLRNSIIDPLVVYRYEYKYFFKYKKIKNTQTKYRKMAGKPSGMWSWWSIFVLWLYETVVFVVWLVIPLIGAWEDSSHATPTATKWLVTVALAANFVSYVFLMFAMKTPRRARTWHFTVGIWGWLWPTVAMWCWDSVFGAIPSVPVTAPVLPLGGISTQESADFSLALRGYVLWKVALMLGVVAALGVTFSAIQVLSDRFELMRYERKK